MKPMNPFTFGLRHLWLDFLGYPLSRWDRSRDRLVSGCMASPPWRWSFGRRSLHIGAWQVPTAAGGGMRLEPLETEETFLSSFLPLLGYFFVRFSGSDMPFGLEGRMHLNFKLSITDSTSSLTDSVLSTQLLHLTTCCHLFRIYIFQANESQSRIQSQARQCHWRLKQESCRRSKTCKTFPPKIKYRKHGNHRLQMENKPLVWFDDPQIQPSVLVDFFCHLPGMLQFLGH